MLLWRGARLSAALFWLGGALLFTASLLQAAEEEEVTLGVIRVETRPEAEEVLQLLKTGEPFEEVARKYSKASNAQEGGYLGKVRLSDLRPEIGDAVKGVGPGGVTRVVQVPSGYAIFKVLSRAERVDAERQARAQRLRVAAPGGFRFVSEVSGLGEVEALFARLSKPPDWHQDLRAVCESRLQAVRVGFEQVENYLADMKAQDPNQRDFAGAINGHTSLAQLWSYQGDMGKAIEHFEVARQIAASHGEKEVQLELEEKLGIARLHQGGLENHAHDAQTQSCLFPMDPGARRRMGSGSERAIQHFLKYLEQDPFSLEAKWLLNLACMTLGRYPDGVPKEHLIPPSVFASKEDIGRFVDVAPSLGLQTFDMAGGAIVDDFDNDGFLDVVTSSWDPCAPMHYFHNNGRGHFTDQASRAGLSGQMGGLNLLQADYNNDGWLDIYVMRGAWSLPARNSLLRNNGDGTFTDVTREAGLAVPATATQTAAWADFDNDGHLDLFVGNELAPSQLFRNRGDGTFVDVGRAAGIDRVRFTKGVVAGDYNNDGYPDFYVSNSGSENFLYRNNRDGTFTEVARQLGVGRPIYSFPVWFFDYNNDDWPDLFAPSYIISVEEVARSYLNLPGQAEGMKLYKNTGGAFEDVTEEVGLDRVFMPMGANFGDVDNDGFLDFYLGTGNPSYASLVPNVLFRNREGKRFVDITASSGTGCLHKGHGIAFGDIDRDGDEDIFIEVGGAVPGDRHRSFLFRNPGQGNNWITVRLVGVKTNRAALGARLKLTLETEGGGRRLVCRTVGSGGSFGASPLRQHIGLGKAGRIEALEVWWPTSDTRQVFYNVSPNQVIEVREFEKKFVKL